MCFESSQLACWSRETLVWVPHGKFARFWLMRWTAVTAHRYDSTTKHLGLMPTHPEKHGPISIHFDLLEQSKERRIAPQGSPRPKIGVKNCPFLGSCTTMRRPCRQPIRTPVRTKAYLYHTNDLGRLLQLAVATGPFKCENWSNFGKIIL